MVRIKLDHFCPRLCLLSLYTLVLLGPRLSPMMILLGLMMVLVGTKDVLVGHRLLWLGPILAQLSLWLIW